MLIFSGSSNKNLAKKIAESIDGKFGGLEIHTFPDRENRVRVEEDVLDLDVLVVESTGVTPNLYYMELFLILDSLKRSGARSITLVIPYLGYQRQDHIFRSGEAVSLQVIIDILESLGVDKFISFEFHSVKIPEFFKSEVVELSAIPRFAEKIKEMNLQDYVLVSPDMGGIARVKKLSEILGGPDFITVEKDRDLNTGDVKSMKFTGKVKKIAIIIDDVISTGKTLIAASNLLKENGAQDIYVMATHGIFAGEAPTSLQASSIKKVIITDTIDVPKIRRFEKLEVISISDMISEELKNS